jgi:membrane fusion protein (multidrug efflux system)
MLTKGKRSERTNSFQIRTEMLNQDASASKPWFRAAEVEVNRLLDRNIISDVMLETAKAKLAQASAYGSIVANITELYIPR